MLTIRIARCITLLVLVVCTLPAQKLPDLYKDEMHGDPPFLSEPGWRPLLNGRDMSGWRALPGLENQWFTAQAVNWRRIFGPSLLVARPAPGNRIVNGRTGRTANLATEEKFGDFELYLEFMNARGSNSGVYLHGLYEIQIFDSSGHDGPLTVGDCGGVYHVAGGGGGSPPTKNACRPPGQWQSLRVWFRAPRFDSAARKTANARILRVLLNDVHIQENVELPGPTQGAMAVPEAATNPIMIQGDHGPVAFRDIYIRAVDSRGPAK
jgi:hypothetical protein